MKMNRTFHICCFLSLLKYSHGKRFKPRIGKEHPLITLLHCENAFLKKNIDNKGVLFFLPVRAPFIVFVILLWVRNFIAHGSMGQCTKSTSFLPRRSTQLRPSQCQYQLLQLAGVSQKKQHLGRL